jgi:hypothetical protein
LTVVLYAPYRCRNRGPGQASQPAPPPPPQAARWPPRPAHESRREAFVSWEAETGKGKKNRDVDAVGNGSSSIFVLPLSCCALFGPNHGLEARSRLKKKNPKKKRKRVALQEGTKRLAWARARGVATTVTALALSKRPVVSRRMAWHRERRRPFSFPSNSNQGLRAPRC